MSNVLIALRRWVRVVGVVSAMLFWLPLVSIGYVLRVRSFSGVGVMLFFRTLCWVIGLKVVQFGSPATQRPVLMVSNHTSYLDIFALGSVLPMAFTPKSEIAGWPLIGTLCRMAGCVFIDRRPRAVSEHRGLIESRLNAGERVVLFPEGTTGLGEALLPFKGGFFSMIAWWYERHQSALPVQPIAMIYTHLGGAPLTHATREQVAWVGDSEFAPHWLAMLGHSGVRVEIHWLPEFLPDVTADRKLLAQQCEEHIGAVLASHPLLSSLRDEVGL